MLQRRRRPSGTALVLCVEVLEDRSLPSAGGHWAALADAGPPDMPPGLEQRANQEDTQQNSEAWSVSVCWQEGQDNNGIGAMVSSWAHSGITGQALADFIHTDLGRGNGVNNLPNPPPVGEPLPPSIQPPLPTDSGGAGSPQSGNSGSGTITIGPVSGTSSLSSSSSGDVSATGNLSSAPQPTATPAPASSVSATLSSGTVTAQLSSTSVEPIQAAVSSSSVSSVTAVAVAQTALAGTSLPTVQEAASASAPASTFVPAPPSFVPQATEFTPTVGTVFQTQTTIATPTATLAATTIQAPAAPAVSLGSVPAPAVGAAAAAAPADLPRVVRVEITTAEVRPVDKDGTDNLAPQGSDEPADLEPVAAVEDDSVLGAFFANLADLAERGQVRQTLPWAAAGVLAAAACEITRRQVWHRRRQFEPYDLPAPGTALPDDPTNPPPGGPV
jgi:hypothetical protein